MQDLWYILANQVFLSIELRFLYDPTGLSRGGGISEEFELISARVHILLTSLKSSANPGRCPSCPYVNT